jgi:hypothetical protein
MRENLFMNEALRILFTLSENCPDKMPGPGKLGWTMLRRALAQMFFVFTTTQA